MSKPVLAVALLAVMAGVWYRALEPATPSARLPAATRAPIQTVHTRAPVVRLDALAPHTADRPAPGGWRNPFRESGPPASDTTSSAASPPVPGSSTSETPVAPPPPAWPRLELIGLAETSQGGGLIRTAIVSGPQGVLHARPGDVLAGVYRLERIGVDGVEVRLLSEDRIIRLPLRR